MNTTVVFGRASDEWATPDDFFEGLDQEFEFTLDGAATAQNTKCQRWYGLGGLCSDALATRPRGERIFVNPPYSLAKEFIVWADAMRHRNNVIVMMLPARTDTRYWHQYIWDCRTHTWRSGICGRFVKGRLTFKGAKHQAPFPSVVIIFRGRSS